MINVMINVNLGYAGYRRTTISSHYMLGNGYRGFNPIIKHFMVQDNQSPFGYGGEHGYRYCNADPINQADPTGHGPLGWLLFDAFSELIIEMEETAAEASGGAIAEGVASGSDLSGEILQGATPIIDAAGDNVTIMASTRSFRTIELGYVKDIQGSGESLLVIHGKKSRGKFLFYLLEGRNSLDFEPLDVKELVEVLNKRFGCDLTSPKGHLLHLVSCCSGRSAAAQELANEVGRPVVSYGREQMEFLIKHHKLKNIKLNSKGFINVYGFFKKLSPFIHIPL